MNALFHNEKVELLGDYLTFLQDVKADGVIFGDPAVLMAAKEDAPDMKLHWNTEITGTNWYTCNYWGRKGAKARCSAREINMDAIVEIKENAEVEIEVQVHGMTVCSNLNAHCLDIILNIKAKQWKLKTANIESNMFLHDKERENKYPIFEDENGTHIMSPNDICIIDELTEIDGSRDRFF